MNLSVSARQTSVVSGRSPFHFYFSMLVAVIVGVGFLPTLNHKLIHPAVPRPWVLYVHAIVFTGWVLLFAIQSTLVWIGRRQWHRRLGLLGLGFGTIIPVLGIMTAITITREDLAGGVADAEQSLIVPVFDMAAFAVLFWSAIYWRRRSDYHRRFMLLATAGLTVAAFARFPGWLIPDNAFYGAVDVLIAIAILRDWVATRRLHPIYRYAVPVLVAGQALTMWVLLSGNPIWRVIARMLLM